MKRCVNRREANKGGRQGGEVTRVRDPGSKQREEMKALEGREEGKEN